MGIRTLNELCANEFVPTQAPMILAISWEISGCLVLLQFHCHCFKPGDSSIADNIEDAVGDGKAGQRRSGLPEVAGKHCRGDGRYP